MNDNLIYQEIPESERESTLREMCNGVAQKTVRHDFSKEEIDGLNAEFASETRAIQSAEAELKVLSEELRGRIKAMKAASKQTLDRASRGYDERNEDCFAMHNHETRRVDFFDRKGRLVESRPMTPEERQTALPFKSQFKEVSNG